MGFVNLDRLTEKYTSGFMQENVENLVEFDVYHCLRAGSVATSMKVQELYDAVPKQFLGWLTICDGGLLFDTVMASVKGYDAELDLEFDTFEELNTEEARAAWNLPEGYVVFAVRNYGDPICFHAVKGDEKIYLWNAEEQDFDDIWNTFEDWITEEIDDAIEFIADDVIEPLGIKLGGEDDE